ncbi:hypothetical protein B1729_03560 [Microbacterium sp. B35-04]|nr:hypothetical protein B1729_03560 [Microbacterium sp. B35-04]
MDMVRITSLSIAYAVADRGWSTTGDNLRLIVNVNGRDILRPILNGVRFGLLTGVAEPAGHRVTRSQRGLPREGFARVFTASKSPPSTGDDWLEYPVDLDTDQLTPLSLRLETSGSDLLRLRCLLLWGTSQNGTVIPLAALADPPHLSNDTDEGVASIPLGLAALTDDFTSFTEVFAFIKIGADRNSRTKSPVSLRFSGPDGTLIAEPALDGFADLESSPGDDERSADVWRLQNLPPMQRVFDPAGPLKVVLRVDGEDNAQIERVVLFGVDPSRREAMPVPIVNFSPVTSGANP